MRALFAYLAVLGSAAFVGTMICIGLAFGGYWTSLSPEAFLTWFAANNGFISRTIPVVAGPALIGLIGSLWIARRDTRSRWAWITAVLAMVGLGVVTGVHHLPANAAFASGAVPPEEVPAALTTWLQLHVLRIALGLVASGFALHATMAGRPA
ncbi:DUF1772 domain-containing protein [Pseudoroseicyclus tamaricis]|uniref:DUF1772 domain-containing protein n=1 Tax=Pseudoroseicyclus tamaricis TaxID=2705421 RepID=A0A6B2JZ87_9RHOB|nr:DUF1772 domain-containing protein [Pseudoroseicyclus tamaricis]NDV01584.1 DUF1772 domain-containing protein [Pseudoroseicyclus tamaricis]